MANEEDKPKRAGRPRKIKKGEEGYYEAIGKKGGKATLKNRGPEYFSRIAKLSHLNRQKPAPASAAQESGSAR